jgi:hypothetical protein
MNGMDELCAVAEDAAHSKVELRCYVLGQTDAERKLFIVLTVRKRRIRIISTFKTEAQEAAFWASHDSTAYIDYTKSRRVVFPRLKPSTVQTKLHLKTPRRREELDRATFQPSSLVQRLGCIDLQPHHAAADRDQGSRQQ